MTNTPQSSIVSKAVLVDLTVSRKTGVRTDKKVTEHVRNEYQAQGNVGRYAKKLFPQDPPELKRVASISNEATTMHKERTLPWATGWRILPRDLHHEYAEDIRKYRSQIDDAVAALVRALPRLKREAEKMLGTMYRDADYPTATEILDGYGIDVRFMPVPDVGDFRVDLDAESMSELQASYAADMQASLAVATRDAWNRLHEVVEGLSSACARVDAKRAADEKLAIMRSAVTENIAAICATLPKLNIMGDKNLEAMRVEVEKKLATFQVADLRDDAKARAEAQKRADAIMKKMAPFLGK